MKYISLLIKFRKGDHRAVALNTYFNRVQILDRQQMSQPISHVMFWVGAGGCAVLEAHVLESAKNTFTNQAKEFGAFSVTEGSSDKR